MKKMILGIMLMITTLSLYAQDPVMVKTTATTNKGYSVPDPIRVSFETSYPDAVWVTWEPAGEWWRATYKGDRKMNQVYYSTVVYYFADPTVFYSVALPVINNYVPDAVVTSAINLYGSKLYSITQAKGNADAEIYQVRLLDKGVAQTAWMNASGTVLTDEEVYKVKVDDGKMKVKVDQ